MKKLRLFATLCVALSACQTGHDAKVTTSRDTSNRATQVLDDATQATHDVKQEVVDAKTRAGQSQQAGLKEASADMQDEAEAQYERLKRQLAGASGTHATDPEAVLRALEAEAVAVQAALHPEIEANALEATAVEAVSPDSLEFVQATPETVDLEGETVQSRLNLENIAPMEPIEADGSTTQAAVTEAAAAIDEVSLEMDLSAYEARMRELATPGPEHQVLNHMEGTFQAVVKLWVMPDAEPAVSTGTSKNSWALGGRFLETHYAGSMLGEAYFGFGHLGYDKVRKSYVGYWVDSMGTQMMNISTGELSTDRKSITLVRTTKDALTGKDVEIKEVLTLTDQDHHQWEMWGFAPDGTYYRMVHIDYTRAE